MRSLPPPRPLAQLEPRLLDPASLLQGRRIALAGPVHEPTDAFAIAVATVGDDPASATAEPHPTATATAATGRQAPSVAVGRLELVAVGGAVEAGEVAVDGRGDGGACGMGGGGGGGHGGLFGAGGLVGSGVGGEAGGEEAVAEEGAWMGG